MEWTPIFEREAAEFTRGDHWQLQFDDTIIPDQQGSGWAQYIRNTCASFRCSRCRRTWPSNQVKVVFHMHLDNYNHQGTVKVRAFRQNCKRCQDAPMEKPSIEAENIKILMENLVKSIRKKCYHEDLGDGNAFYVGVDVNSPHEPQHCEGCMAGICNRERTLPHSSRKFR